MVVTALGSFGSCTATAWRSLSPSARRRSATSAAWRRASPAVTQPSRVHNSGSSSAKGWSTSSVERFISRRALGRRPPGLALLGERPGTLVLVGMAPQGNEVAGPVAAGVGEPHLQRFPQRLLGGGHGRRGVLGDGLAHL